MRVHGGRRHRGRWRNGLVAGGVAIASSLLAGCIDIPSLSRPDIPEGIPPGPGVTQPYIDINAPGRTADLMREWAEPIAEATGIPLVSLQAYGNAAEIQRQQHPECGITWTTLAGIAGVESKHGRHRGSKVAANGDVSPPIRGAKLDGTRGNMEIVDTDGGRLDGDATHDRAMGPFQFIPETWKRFGVDANGDGVPDPDNIDDAALSAARYLCVSSGNDMTVPEGWEKAVRTYNNSSAYVLDVRDHANAYSVNVKF
ncbi:lytic murein transglycosylase [Gordonia paraffinivorans]|uniref:Lytic murein transglycosylase n=1 Tax=Gordonia paraffinivorans TaxID=175628 RepID=A0ABD7V7M8_9ACTN|nr:lytic murein transglycosylase [Gordonia paraffinivorans]MCD2147488.1 lytic murein transglycosylase [Gordonia paraffinivorans]VFA90209.1 lytic murein transglycosylase [Gordonia paraffinivorans]